MRVRRLLVTTAISMGVMIAAFTSPALAHCDSMDGPVVADAQRAIAAKDVTPVLKWIPAADEAEIRRSFDMTLAVRGESDTARTVADRYFFETLIRVHRAGEGDGFTGLKPAGSVSPPIAAADKALRIGNVNQLADELATGIRHGVEARFTHALELRKTADKSVAQGREYVEAYVEFTHFAENAAHLLEAGADHQHRETAAAH